MLAWQEFVEIYQPLIRSLALRRGLQAADSEDVTQEVLTRVAKYIESWDPSSEHSSFRAWLATITKNQTIQFFRQRSRRPATGADSQINHLPSELREENDFDLEHDRQLFAWAARRVQSQFTSKTWQAFWLTAVEEKTVQDTARQLETSAAQVYVARSRVMSALKRSVEQSEFESKADWRIS
jgi:RNA polymerase sigma factor (sigma-70 family)